MSKTSKASRLEVFRAACKAERAYSLKVLSDNTPVGEARAGLAKLQAAGTKAFRAYKKSPEYV